MITSIQHKGLKQFFENGSKKDVQSDHARRLVFILQTLDTADTIDDVDMSGLNLPPPLKGMMKGRWSIFVSGNWRLTFEFNNGNVELLNYEDYH